jgi:hypothetical protein
MLRIRQIFNNFGNLFEIFYAFDKVVDISDTKNTYKCS